MKKDEEIIETIAQVWVDNGGDAEGIEWCWLKIRDKVRELTESETCMIR